MGTVLKKLHRKYRWKHEWHGVEIVDALLIIAESRLLAYYAALLL
jgi:hypothetical protein